MSQTTTSNLGVSIGPPRQSTGTISLPTTTGPTDTTSTTTPSSTTTLTTSTISTTGTTISGISSSITLTGIASASVPHLSLPLGPSTTLPTSTSTSAASASRIGPLHDPGFLLGLPGLVLLVWMGALTLGIFRPSRQ